MLAIEKPFPVVQASLGGFASLAVGFAGSVALLTMLTPNTNKSPSNNPTSSQPVAIEESDTTNTAKASAASPQQFTSTYETPAYTWRMATPVRSTAIASSTTKTARSAAAAPQSASAAVADTSSSASQPVSSMSSPTAPSSTATTTTPATTSSPTTSTGSTGGPIITVPTLPVDPLLPVISNPLPNSVPSL